MSMCLFFLIMLPPLPTSTLFPYTTLFRSHAAVGDVHALRPDIHVGEQVFPHVAPVAVRTVRTATGATCGKTCSPTDRKSTRLNSSHQIISYAVFCLKKKKKNNNNKKIIRD